MATVFVDTETTGIPDKDRHGNCIDPRDKAAYENARLISLAYTITDKEGSTLVEPTQIYIKPYGYTVPKHITDITNITDELLNERGVRNNEAITKFENDIRKHDVNLFVSYNVNFDKSIIMNCALRRGWRSDSLLVHMARDINYHCVSRRVKNYLNESKYLKLEQSIKRVLDEEPENLHNSLDDMLYCKRLYFKVINK